MKIIKKSVLLLLILFLIACSEDKKVSTNPNPDNTISDNLHISWKSPDWTYSLPCDDLSFIPEATNSNQYCARASSASTKISYGFFYPKDSSQVVKASAIGKYAIQQYSSFSNPYASDQFFQFYMSMPITLGNSEKIYSKAGFSEYEFNEVVSVKYLNKQDNFAVFLIKCRYAMKMTLKDLITEKSVTGNYTFKIYTDRN